MARSPNDPPRNLPDRMMRDALVQPDNLRALVREVAPDIADHLDYSRVEVVGKPYFLDYRETAPAKASMYAIEAATSFG